MDSKRNIQLIDDDSKNDHKYQVSLLINGHIPALVNSLRRTMISEIPNVGFDTKTQEDISLNKIRIIENTNIYITIYQHMLIYCDILSDE